MDAVKQALAIALTSALGVLFLRMLAESVRALLKKSSSTETLSAVLKEKSEETGESALGENGLRNGKKVYRAVFETENGDRDALISESEYNSLTEGARGTLYCRGGKFLGFTPDSLARSENDEKN